MMCFWQISQDPVTRYASNITLGVWHTCHQYTNRVEGEREVSVETKKLLRWRIVDREAYPVPGQVGSIPSSNLTYNNTRLGFVYGLPLNKYIYPYKSSKILN
jgi:hypothetical protein